MAATFADERPGVDVLNLPRDVTVSVSVTGRCVAGLAEAINVRLQYELIGDAVEHVRNLSGPLSAVGLMMADVVDEDAVEECRPLRWCCGSSEISTWPPASSTGGRGPGAPASEGRAGAERLANTFRGDANLLSALLSLTEGPGPVAEPTAP